MHNNNTTNSTRVADLLDDRSTLEKLSPVLWIGSADALAVVRSTAEIVIRNAAADRLLGQGQAVYISGNILSYRNKKDAAAFDAVVRRRWRRPTYFAFRNEAQQVVLGVEVRTYAPTGQNVLRLANLQRQDFTRLSPVAAIYGLTPTEKRILARLLRGEDANDIAERRDITVMTVRTHIKNIYRKLNVSNRGELFELVLRLKF